MKKIYWRIIETSATSFALRAWLSSAPLSTSNQLKPKESSPHWWTYPSHNRRSTSEGYQHQRGRLNRDKRVSETIKRDSPTLFAIKFTLTVANCWKIVFCVKNKIKGFLKWRRWMMKRKTVTIRNLILQIWVSWMS